tara:strand:+ start:1731 stop:2372 length:642 start_codon:yes stop_codon:yes gene_type:complete
MIETKVGNFIIHNYGNNIFVIKNLIHKKLCEEVIDIINNEEDFCKIDYAPGNNVKGYENSLQRLLKTYNEGEKKKYYTYIYNNIIIYIKTICFIVKKIKNTDYLFNEIPKIGEIILRKITDETIPHYDGIVNIEEIRELTCIIGLNKDYKNGEFEFPEYNINLKLETGDVLLFPPYWTHVHNVKKPENNFRYTITVWFFSYFSKSGWKIENIN